MMIFLKTWINQIIVSVIIATIIEMILPNGNNKKYIKVIIGLYILFTIIQPIIVKFTGKGMDISKFDYEKYLNKDALEVSLGKIENNNSKLIKQTYINNIRADIESKLNKKGYEVINCNISILDDERKNTYGTINKIILKLKKNNIKESNNIIKIENVDIIANDNVLNCYENNSLIISKNEKNEITEYLTQIYSIDKKNIIIN